MSDRIDAELGLRVLRDVAMNTGVALVACALVLLPLALLLCAAFVLLL